MDELKKEIKKELDELRKMVYGISCDEEAGYLNGKEAALESVLEKIEEIENKKKG